MKKIINWANKPFAVYPDVTERIVYLLIFLFPIAGMSVRHWITNIFNILVLIALFTLRKPREPLLKQEKYFLWICVAYFSMFIISSLANGWEKTQTYYLGTELRFLLIIPLYLLLRRYPDCSKWLLRGAILGGGFLFSQAYYDVFIMGYRTAQGVYSKNLIGPFAVLTGFWSLYFVWENFTKLKSLSKIIIILSIIAAFTTASLSGSRGSYIGFLITGLSCIMFFSKPRWMFSGLIVICLISFLSYQNSRTVKQGVDVAINGTQQYFQADDHIKDKSSYSSTGIRLEMMRTGISIIRDNPLTGIGPGNYIKITQHYIQEAKASPSIRGYTNPHNAFLEVASAKGIIGLICLLMLFYYPAYIYIKGYKASKQTAILGLMHVILFSSFSLTDHSVVLMNNYTSILLLGMAIFLSAHIRQCKHI